MYDKEPFLRSATLVASADDTDWIVDRDRMNFVRRVTKICVVSVTSNLISHLKVVISNGVQEFIIHVEEPTSAPTYYNIDCEIFIPKDYYLIIRCDGSSTLPSYITVNGEVFK